MNPILSLDPEFSARFVMTLAHFLWQGAAIGVAVFLLGFVLRRASSRLRYGVYLAALLAMALCPLVTYSLIGQGALASPQMDPPPGAREWGAADPFSQPDRTYRTDQTDRTDPSDPSDRAGSFAVADTSTPGEDTAIAAAPPADLAPGTLEFAAAPSAATDWRTYTPYLILAYIAGVILMLGRLALGLAGGGRLRKRAERITDNAILDALQRQAAQLRLRAVPVVAYCQRVAVPTVVGVIRPMILLPASLATGMPPQQVELLLLHELAHIRRYDHLINIAQRLIEAALFFHPALWYVSHRIRVEREHCCDDLVIALGGERRAYAESLVTAAALASGASLSPAALAATGKPSQLRRRIHRMLGDPQPPVRLVRGGWVLTVLVAVALIAGATQLGGPAPEDPIAEDAPELVIVPKGAVEVTVPESELDLVEEVESEEQEAVTSQATPEAAPVDVVDPEAVQKMEEIAKKWTELKPQLEDPDWWLRKVAVQQLGEMPHYDTLVQRLILMLKDEDARVQAAAAEALAKQGDPKAIKHLVAALKEESDVREAAAEALTHFEPDDVMPLLTLAARDEEPQVFFGAITALGKQNTSEAAVLLVEFFPRIWNESYFLAKGSGTPVRRSTGPAQGPQAPPFEAGALGERLATAFRDMDPSIAEQALLDAFRHSDWETLAATALIASKTDLEDFPSIHQSLLDMLTSPLAQARSAAAYVFADALKEDTGHNASTASDVAAALLPLLRDPNLSVARTAATALSSAQWQPDTPEERAWYLVAEGQCKEAAQLGSIAYEPLAHALHADWDPVFSPPGNLRATSRNYSGPIEGLMSIDDPRKVEALIDAIGLYPVYTGSIVDELGDTGDPRAVDTLVGLLGNLDMEIRSSAIYALGKIGDSRAVGPLLALLVGEDETMRYVTIKALGEIGDPRAIEAIRPFLDRDYSWSSSAAKALGKLGDTQSVPKILKLYKETSGNIGQPSRSKAETFGEALGSIGGPEVRDGMIDILSQNASASRREQAAEILGQIGDPAAVPALSDATRYDTELGVKLAACTALGQIGGGDAARALKGLLELNSGSPPKYQDLISPAVKSLALIKNNVSTEALVALFADSRQFVGGFENVRLVAAKALAKRGDPRARAMLEELREIPETRIEATNALQELEQQSPPDAESSAPDAAAERAPDPAVPTDRTDPSDQSDPSDQPATGASQSSQLTGPRLQFRWVVEGDGGEAKTILPAPTESEPDRTLAVGDEVVLYEGGIATAEVQKDPNTDQYAVHFETNERWAERLLIATEQNQGKALAIIFDGRILSAPIVQAAFGKSGSITGNFTQVEAEAIAKAILGANGQGDHEPLPEPFLYDSESFHEEEVLNKGQIGVDPEAIVPEELPEPFLYDSGYLQ